MKSWRQERVDPSFWPEIEETTLEELSIFPTGWYPPWLMDLNRFVKTLGENFSKTELDVSQDLAMNRSHKILGVDEMLLGDIEGFHREKVPALPRVALPKIEEIKRRFRAKRDEERRVIEEARQREEAAREAEMKALAEQIAEEERKAKEALRLIAEKKAQRIALQREKTRRRALLFSPRSTTRTEQGNGYEEVVEYQMW